MGVEVNADLCRRLGLCIVNRVFKGDALRLLLRDLLLLLELELLMDGLRELHIKLSLLLGNQRLLEHARL